jgi:hypothetical protein
MMMSSSSMHVRKQIDARVHVRAASSAPTARAIRMVAVRRDDGGRGDVVQHSATMCTAMTESLGDTPVASFDEFSYCYRSLCNLTSRAI